MEDDDGNPTTSSQPSSLLLSPERKVSAASVQSPLTPVAMTEGMSRMQAKRLSMNLADAGNDTRKVLLDGTEQQQQQQQEEEEERRQQQLESETTKVAAAGSNSRPKGKKTEDPRMLLVRSHGVVVQIETKYSPRRRKTTTEKLKERKNEERVTDMPTSANAAPVGANGDPQVGESKSPKRRGSTLKISSERRRFTIQPSAQRRMSRRASKFTGRANIASKLLSLETHVEQKPRPSTPETPIVFDDALKQQIEAFFRSFRKQHGENNRITILQLMSWYYPASHPDVILKQKGRNPKQVFESFLRDFKVSHVSSRKHSTSHTEDSTEIIVTSRDFVAFMELVVKALSLEALQKHYGTVHDLLIKLWRPLTEVTVPVLIPHSDEPGSPGVLLSTDRDRGSGVPGVSPYMKSPMLVPPKVNESAPQNEGSRPANLRVETPTLEKRREEALKASLHTPTLHTPTTPIDVNPEVLSMGEKKSPMYLFNEWHFSEHQDMSFPMKMVEHQMERTKLKEEWEQLNGDNGRVDVDDKSSVQEEEGEENNEPMPIERTDEPSNNKVPIFDKRSQTLASEIKPSAQNSSASTWKRAAGSPRRGSVLMAATLPRPKRIEKRDIHNDTGGIIEEDEEENTTCDNSASSSSTSSSSTSHTSHISMPVAHEIGEKLFAGIKSFEGDERLVKVIIYEGMHKEDKAPLFICLKGECLSTGDVTRILIYPHDWTASSFGDLRVLEMDKKELLAKWIFDNLTILPSNVGKGLVLGVDNVARAEGTGRPNTPPGTNSPRSGTSKQELGAASPLLSNSPRTPARKGRRRMSTFAGGSTSENERSVAHTLTKAYSDTTLDDKTWRELQVLRTDSILRIEIERRRKLLTAAYSSTADTAEDAVDDLIHSATVRENAKKHYEYGQISNMNCKARWRWAIFRILKYRRIIRMARAMSKEKSEAESAQDFHNFHDDQEDDHILNAAIYNSMSIAAFPWEKQEADTARFQKEFQSEENDIQKALHILENKPPGDRTFGDMEGVRLAVANIEFFRKVEATIPNEVSKLLQGTILIQAPSLQELFCQGEQAEGMYVIITGSVDVFVTRKMTKGVATSTASFKVTTLEKGETFGEGGLVEKKPRAATIVTAEASQLLFIPSQIFMDTLHKSKEAEAQLMRKTLATGSVTTFIGRNERVAKEVLAGSSMRLFRSGQVVCRQGERSHHIFVIKSGEVRLLMQRVDAYGRPYANEGALELEPRLHTGACFGAALLDTTELQKIINGVAEGTHQSNYRESYPRGHLHHTLSIIAVTELHVLEVQLAQIEQLAPRMYAQLMNDFNTKYRQYFVKPDEWMGLKKNALAWRNVATELVSDACPGYGTRKHFADDNILISVPEASHTVDILNRNLLDLSSDDSTSTVSVKFVSLASMHANMHQLLRADFYRPIKRCTNKVEEESEGDDRILDATNNQSRATKYQEEKFSKSQSTTTTTLNIFTKGSKSMKKGDNISKEKKEPMQRAFRINLGQQLQPQYSTQQVHATWMRDSAWSNKQKKDKGADMKIWRQRDALRPDYSASGMWDRPGSTGESAMKRALESVSKIRASETVVRASNIENRLQKLLRTGETLIRIPIQNDKRFISVLRPSSAPNPQNRRRRGSNNEKNRQKVSQQRPQSAKVASSSEIFRTLPFNRGPTIADQFPVSRPQTTSNRTGSRLRVSVPTRPRSAPKSASRSSRQSRAHYQH